MSKSINKKKTALYTLSPIKKIIMLNWEQATYKARLFKSFEMKNNRVKVIVKKRPNKVIILKKL